MQLVVDKVEWRYWATHGKCAKANHSGYYDVLTEGGDVILQPGEEVELLFKFLTLREVPLLPNLPHPDPSHPLHHESHLSTYPPELYIRPRKLQLIILHSNRHPYSNTEINIMP